jgi:hypothetical protein
MLKVALHAGVLKTRAHSNELGVLDIAYRKQEALAEYLVALSLRQAGELEPAIVSSYPRWSASVWDLVARALTRVLYKDDQAPSAGTPDKRCAYATRICASIELQTAADRGRELGSVEIAQRGKQRGLYTAAFTEDILGERTVDFEYGQKALNPADLLLRAICWALYGADVLGPRPKLILPPTMAVAGVDRFHIEALAEPAKTGFVRHLALRFPTAQPEALPKAEDYVSFLMKG